MSSTELNELRGTLARDAQRAQEPMNQWFAHQQRLQRKRTSADERKDPEACKGVEAERYVKELSHSLLHKIGLIQNACQSRQRLKELNDAINEELNLKLRYEAKAHGRAPEEVEVKPYTYFGAYRDYEHKVVTEDDDERQRSRGPQPEHTIVESADLSEALNRRMTPFYWGIGVDTTEMERLERLAEAHDAEAIRKGNEERARVEAENKAAEAEKKVAEAVEVAERKAALLKKYGKAS